MNILQQINQEKKNIKSLPDKTYNLLLRDILTGKIPKDSRLNEKTLCEKYKVSRTPLREAFRRLEMDGLVEYIPNRGDFVRGFSNTEIHDMLQVWADLKVRSIEWVVNRITEDEEEDLANLFQHMEFYTKKNDISKMIDINLAFHKLLADYTHDSLVAKNINTYQTYVNYCCPPNYFADNYLTKVLEEHRRIYRAIVRKDVDAAIKSMQTHMERTIKRNTLSLK